MTSILVFQTDFTYKEAAVSSMYGVVKRVDRHLEIFDSTHYIPNYDIWSASFRLFQPLIFWPEGTVFVSVVDPGVGTSRRASIAKTKNGYYIVTPDNGTLSHVAYHYGIEKVVEIDIEKHRLKGLGTEGISVFHGRDVFAYCAARLASGQVKFEDFGDEYPVDEIVIFDLSPAMLRESELLGRAEIIDPNFGNLWSNIPMDALRERLGQSVGVEILDQDGKVWFDEKVQVNLTFGEVQKNQLTLYQNEYGNVSIALNQASFITQYPIPYGQDIKFKITL